MSYGEWRKRGKGWTSLEVDSPWNSDEWRGNETQRRWLERHRAKDRVIMRAWVGGGCHETFLAFDDGHAVRDWKCRMWRDLVGVPISSCRTAESREGLDFEAVQSFFTLMWEFEAVRKRLSARNQNQIANADSWLSLTDYSSINSRRTRGVCA